MHKPKANYTGSTYELKHVYEVLKLISVMADDDRYIKPYYYKKMKGGIHNMCDVVDRIEKMGADKKEKEKEDLAKKETEMKEGFAKKMLAAGKPQAEVVEFSGLSRSKVAQLAKMMAAAII